MKKETEVTLKIPQNIQLSETQWASAVERARFRSKMLERIEKKLASANGLPVAKVRGTRSGSVVVSERRVAGSEIMCMGGEYVIIVWQYDYDTGICRVLSENHTGISCSPGTRGQNFD